MLKCFKIQNGHIEELLEIQLSCKNRGFNVRQFDFVNDTTFAKPCKMRWSLELISPKQTWLLNPQAGQLCTRKCITAKH